MELRENWKYTVPIHFFITGIKTAGRYFALIVYSVISNDSSWKPSKLDFGFDVFSWVPSATSLANLHVNVLLHELYPAKEASGAGPIDRDGRLPPQDFIQALQKIDLEGGASGDLGESSFVFQPTSQPSTCSTSWTRSPSCKPCSSNDELVDPVFSPLPVDPLWSDSIKGEVSASPSIPPTTMSDSPAVVDPQSNLAVPLEMKEVYHGAADPLDLFPSESSSCHSMNEIICLADEAKSDVESSSSHLEVLQPVSISGPCMVRENPIVTGAEDVPSQTNTYPLVLRLDADVLCRPTSSTQTRMATSEATHHTLQHANNDPVISSSSIPSQSVGTSRRKAVLKPVNVGQRQSRSASFSSASDLELLSGSSLDSGLDSRILVDKHDHASSSNDRNRHSLLGTSSRSCGSLSLTAGDSSSCPTRGYTTSSTTASHRSQNRREDCHQRDIAALEEANVPFSYEEIIYSNNEHFRELRSAPYLTQHQLDVMLDARKRATNRLAAERCRRLKIATRDDLSEQLAALRMERQLLVRQVAQARQRKQRASDALQAEQKRILSLLRSPGGEPLKYSDWRVRLTHDDEVVVVAAGQ